MDPNFEASVLKRWDGGKPTTLEELFIFYHDYVKPLYAYVQTENVLPQEVLFELNAALDHISRHWSYGEAESTVVSKAFSHLKRSCLDMFKIQTRVAIDQYKELKRIDVSIINNGKFKPELIQLAAKIKRNATKARRAEGQLDTEEAVPAFALWEEVFQDCIKLEDQFYLNEHVQWAQRTGIRSWLSKQWTGLLVGIFAGLIAGLAILFLDRSIPSPPVSSEAISPRKSVKLLATEQEGYNQTHSNDSQEPQDKQSSSNPNQ